MDGQPAALSPQLSLGLELEPTVSLDNFNAIKNPDVILHIKALLSGQGERFLYLYGPAGCGKSHLLQGACSAAMQNLDSAIYVSMKDRAAYSEEMLLNLESLSLVCIDDIEVIAGDLAWEEALFHLYNASIVKGTRLLMAGLAVPAQLQFHLPDLSSRLAWGLGFKVERLSDSAAIKVIQDQAKETGLKLSSEVLQFLYRRTKRDMASQKNTFEQLKLASVLHKRAITIPFVKRVLGL